MPIFNDDLDEAESRDAASKSFNRLNEWSIKDGEKLFLRFIRNGAIPMDVHQYIPTKDKPEDCNWTKWPSMMWGVCPRDKAFRVAGPDGRPTDEYEEGYGECYIHVAYAGQKGKFGKDMGVPVVVSYGLAVPRKIVLDPVTGKPRGLEDETFEFRTPEGDIVRLPKVVIVAQKYAQLWGAVNATKFLPNSSICDRDFQIVRKENDLKVTALDKTPEHQPGTPSWERYKQAVELLDVSVEKYLTDHASRDHYARFFIPGETPEGGYGGGSGDDDEAKPKDGPATTATAPEVPQDKMDAFRDSLKNRAPAAAAEDQGVAEPV